MSRLKKNSGQGLVEYVLVLVLMGILAIGALEKLGTSTQNGISKSQSALDKEFNKIK